MKLYDYGQAPNPRRVRVYLAEKGIDVDLEEINILERQQKTPEFLTKNPLGSIPVLELDDGTCISESIAICRYFEALHPDPPLFGRTAKEIALVDMWLRRVELNVMGPVGQVWIHGHPLTAKLLKQIPDAADFGRMRAAAGYALLNTQLQETEFIAGDTYTIADVVALTTLDFATGLVGVPYAEDMTSLKRWHDQVAARPSAKA